MDQLVSSFKKNKGLWLGLNCFWTQGEHNVNS